MSMVEWLPFLILLFIFISAILVYYIVAYSVFAGEIFTNLVIAISMVLMFFMVSPVIGGEVLLWEYRLFSFPLSISFRVDVFSLFISMLMIVLWLLATIYSRDYFAKGHGHARYYTFMLLALFSNLGAAWAGDMLGFLLFFEMLALTSYVLVIHEEDSFALFAGDKYLYMSIAGGLGVVLGVVTTYFLVGDLSFGNGGYFTEPSLFSLVAFIAFIFGLGVKAGIFPVHVWLPDAHPAAPAPVSALLSGIMIKVGAYGVFRVIFDLFGSGYILEVGWNQYLLIIAAITMLIGSAMALRQDDLKRRLAYSSVAQIGYVFLGLSLLTEDALVGATFHIFAHAVMKGLLFLCAGAIIVQTGRKKISQLAGVGRIMPLTMGCFVFASLSMVGIPPFNGFLTKWQLSMGALEAGAPFYVFLLIVSSLLNAAYYFPIIEKAFWDEPDSEMIENKEAGPVMTLPMMLLGLGTFVFVVLPWNFPLEAAQNIVQSLLLI